MEQNFLCLECKKSYSFRRNLRAHIIKCHPSKLEELAPTLRTPRKFTCDDCEEVFSKQNLLRAHKLTEHDKNNAPKPAEDNKSHKCRQNKQKCPLCDFASRKAELLNHFKNFHAICIVTEDLQFSSFQEFSVWKKDIETKTNCSFVLGRGAQKKNSDIQYYFVCHRSGVYTARGNGFRHLKVQGSKKINGFCPASITVIENDGKCSVHYVKTHVGHKNEIGHMFLSKEDRMCLASKIASGIPFERILNEIRDSVAENKTRMHLVTRHDLHNIVFQFKLGCIRRTDAGVNAEALDHALQHTENSCQLTIPRCRKNKKSVNRNNSVGHLSSSSNNSVGDLSGSSNNSVGDLSNDYNNSGDLSSDYDDEKDTNRDVILSKLVKNAPSTSKTLMEKVQKMNENFLSMTCSIQNDAEYHAIKRLFDAMQPTLDAVRAHNGSFSETASPPSKNIIKDMTKKKSFDVSQRHLFSIKREKEKNKKIM